MQRNRTWSPRRRYGVALALLAAIAALVLAVVLEVPVYPAWLLGLSVVTFFAYGYDKRQAVRGGGRVPEIVLHGLALAGGFPGGWAGRSVFRHKTRHTSFLIVLIISTMIHAGLIWQLYVS